MSYVAPLKDMLFNIEHLAQIDQVAQMPGFEDAGLETAQAVLQECAKLNQDVLAPLNWEGDKNPSAFSNGHVKTTPGFKEAFKQYGEGGWQGLQHPTEFGGQGLPKTIGAACGEMLNSANQAWTMYPGLSNGAYECLHAHPKPAPIWHWCAHAPSLCLMAPSKFLAQKFTSPMVSMTWLTTSCTWCWPVCKARLKA